MKIGIAFSGSGKGAVAAHLFAEKLRENALKIEMLSTTSLPSVPLLLWARGFSDGEIDALMQEFIKAPTSEEGIDRLEAAGAFARSSQCKFAVSSVDIMTGVVVIFSDDVYSDAWNLKTLPLAGNERAALLSTLSPCLHCEPYAGEGMQLCNFAVRYGCPYFPLKMAGMQRLLSVSFAGGETPAQIAADSLSALTGKNADLHYTLPVEPKQAQEQINAFFKENLEQIYEKLLF